MFQGEINNHLGYGTNSKGVKRHQIEEMDILQKSKNMKRRIHD